MQLIIDYKVPFVFPSAGNPKTFTSILKAAGIKVVHVVSSNEFVQKSEAAGCDAIVAEGFKAGGHNGREETTSFVLITAVKEKVSIPVITAGAIETGRKIVGAIILGTDAVKIGTRVNANHKASCHLNFKNAVVFIS